jgi:hypothetical protein
VTAPTTAPGARPAAPPFGLLLDVDGPLCSTVTRSIRLPSIAEDLAAIANAGCPVVFNTGRSDTFMTSQVVPRLVDAGLADDAPVWGVGEKGLSWFAVSRGAGGGVELDDSMAVPPELEAACLDVAGEHRDVAFRDQTKRAMLTLERRTDVSAGTFLSRRPQIAAQLTDAIAACGDGERFHVIETSIALDVEHRDSGKALGADRAMGLVTERMDAPLRWYTVGDSDSDHDMARRLHDAGHRVAHLDVAPRGASRQTPYDVIREVPTMAPGDREDDVTATYLSLWRAGLRT